MSKLRELSTLGQSIWYDYVRRALFSSGELQALIERGLGGVTSNPSIFEKAIAGSADYDEDLYCRVDEGLDARQIYESLAIEDIGQAADLLLPVYRETEGKDGYVSLEVSPDLAADTEKTVAEAQRLFEALQRPNVMIKVPATAAGIPAIRRLIAMGININMTLIFSIDNYRKVADAYLGGLEELAAAGPKVRGGHSVNRVASVASFFVSRVDSAVDAALEKIGNRSLQGKIAIANARVAYHTFREIFAGERWEKLAAQGARVQRPLWASTGVKNPIYPDTLYVDQLIGRDTVNTVPPATLTAFEDHGTVAATLEQDLAEARQLLKELQKTGIDLVAITGQLQKEGVEAFLKAFQSLLKSIDEKARRVRSGQKNYSAVLGDFQPLVDKALADLRDRQIISRVWQHDHKVWKSDPTEITNRLGWLHSPAVMTGVVNQLNNFVEEVRKAGFSRALLLGMGGSSLAPEVFRRTFGVAKGFLDLGVLDSTDPAAVLQKEKEFPPEKTLFIVSTKSGGTVETMSFLKYFYNKTVDAVGSEKAAEHFVAITDPKSGLEALATRLNFRRIFLNDPNIGGRYSALSYFGLVPAALIGMDISLLLERASTMACNCEGCNCPVAGDNSGGWLGAIMGTLARKGRDKLTLVLSPQIRAFGAWLEQLIAESTGKEGRGILPVDGEEVLHPARYSEDRLFVYLRLQDDHSHDRELKALAEAGHPLVEIMLRDSYDLGGEFFRWEMATAIAGMVLDINPFDQPNVESAKVQARKKVAAFQESGKLPQLKATLVEDGITLYDQQGAANLSEALNRFLSEQPDKGTRPYVALQAYLPPAAATDEALATLRRKIQESRRFAVTVGYGPRFLHSTGQLHKGDSGNGLFIQFSVPAAQDVPIPDDAGAPGSSISFGVLKEAQALGDRQALLDAHRRVIRLDLGGNTVDALNRLTGMLR